MAVKLPILQTKDPVMNRYQTLIQQALAPITNNQAAASTLIRSITLNSGSVNKVPHSLGVPLTGWHLTRIRGQATIWDTQDSNTTETSTYLYLWTSTMVTVDLLVF